MLYTNYHPMPVGLLNHANWSEHISVGVEATGRKRNLVYKLVNTVWKYAFRCKLFFILYHFSRNVYTFTYGWI